MKVTKLFFGLSLALVMASCGTQKTTTATEVKMPEAQMITITEQVVGKKAEMSEEEVRMWPHMDIIKDSVPGMSLDKAYEFVANKKAQTTIVAVIDSGIDIEHEDLDGVIWVNEDEVPNNGIDDDKNGYVDDMHGWNFLGGEAGQSAPEQLEITRIVAKFLPQFDGKTAEEIPAADQENYAYYLKLKEEVNTKQKSAEGQKTFYEGLISTVKGADQAVKTALNKDSYTLEELSAVELEPSLAMGKGMIMRIMDAGMSIDDGLKDVQRGVDYFTQQASNHYNVNFNGRLNNDDIEDITDAYYGNNLVIGSKEVESHGTHVSGIILAERNNGIGMNGVTQYAKLMCVRAVPDGDEYDKDVALAIRYAVDNGAKVINMSFGKSYSPHAQWVYDAIKYAESKDVLLVHAAGNDSKDIDVENNFPNDSQDKISEFADNVITVGAMTRFFNEKLPASFSNYGIKNVDVFAPGHDIYATVPANEYDSYQGTSMASPEVAGVAALVRSFYPQLTASQVKHIIMDSGISFDQEVNLPSETKGTKKNFTQLSVSGKIVNAYNALVLADKMVNKK